MEERQKNFKKILKFVQKTVDFPIKYSKIKEYFCIHNKLVCIFSGGNLSGYK